MGSWNKQSIFLEFLPFLLSCPLTQPHAHGTLLVQAYPNFLPLSSRQPSPDPCISLIRTIFSNSPQPPRNKEKKTRNAKSRRRRSRPPAWSILPAFIICLDLTSFSPLPTASLFRVSFLPILLARTGQKFRRQRLSEVWEGRGPPIGTS